MDNKIELKKFRETFKGVMEEFSGWHKAEEALETLANELGVQIEPRSFTIEGYAFISSELGSKEIGLYSDKHGGDTHIPLKSKFVETFGGGFPVGWARKKYKLTVEEILED